MNPGRCDKQGTLAKPLEYLCVESKRGGAPETSHRQWEGRSHARIPPCVEERNYYSDRKCPLRTKRERKSNKTLHLVALWHYFSSADKKAGGYKSFQSEKEKCKKKKVAYKGKRGHTVLVRVVIVTEQGLRTVCGLRAGHRAVGPEPPSLW